MGECSSNYNLTDWWQSIHLLLENKLTCITSLLFLHELLVIFDFFVGHRIEWILSVGSFVHERVMLIISLNDSLRSRAHEYNLITRLSYVCVL